MSILKSAANVIQKQYEAGSTVPATTVLATPALADLTARATRC